MEDYKEFVLGADGFRFCTTCNGIDPHDFIELLEKGWQVYEDPFQPEVFHIAGPFPPLKWIIMQEGALFIPFFKKSYELNIGDISLEQGRQICSLLGHTGRKN